MFQLSSLNKIVETSKSYFLIVETQDR